MSGRVPLVVMKATVLVLVATAIVIVLRIRNSDPVWSLTTLLMTGFLLLAAVVTGAWEVLSSKPWGWGRSMATLLLVMLGTVWLAVTFIRPRPQGINSIMASMGDRAVAAAKAQWSVELDYQPASVEQVEFILGRLHEANKRSEPVRPEKDFTSAAAVYGAYIGEVIRRTKGGHWEEDHPQGGPKSMPLYWQDHASFPVAWCYKRIANGEEDNVWLKFRVIVLEDAATHPAEELSVDTSTSPSD